MFSQGYFRKSRIWQNTASLQRRSLLPNGTTTAQVKSLERFRTVQTRFWSADKENYLPLTENNSASIDINDSIGENTLAAEISLQRDSNVNATNDVILEPIDTTSRRQFLVKSISDDIKTNVINIIEHIDCLKTKISLTEDVGSLGRHSKGKKRVQKSLSERWNAAFHREKQRYYKMLPGNEMARKVNLTIDEMWDQAMQSAGIPFLLETHHEEAQSQGNLSEIDVSDACDTKKPSESLVSPIFGLPIDENGVVLDSNMQKSINCEFDSDGVSISDETLAVMDENVLMAATENSSHKSETQSDGTLCALALFAVTRKVEWDLFRHDPLIGNSSESPHQDQGTHTSLNERERDSVSDLLEYSRLNRLLLTSEECNLLLARVLASTTLTDDVILEKSLQLFNEMQHLAATGIEGSGPNATTYRLLFSALPRRLVAIGEAARICKSMPSSAVVLNPQTLLEAIKVCHRYGDLETASKLTNDALLDDTKSTFTVGSCLIFLHMLQTRNMMKEALSFFDEIQKGRVLRHDREDELLLQLCRWPNRSRNGDAIDCTSILHHVMNNLFDKIVRGERPQLQLWLELVERLTQAAKLDPSLENNVNQTIRRMLDAYPDAYPGNRLLRIGLHTADITRDAELIARILVREVTKKLDHRARIATHVRMKQEEDLFWKSPISLIVFRKALEISLKNSDADSAAIILEQYSLVGSDYPLIAKVELCELVIRTYARVADGEKARTLLFSMINDGMKPSENLIGVVLHSLVTGGMVDDARKIFESMREGTENLPSPNVTSFNAMLVASMQAREWDEAIELIHRMKENGVSPNTQTIQGLMLAHLNKDGKNGIISLMRQLLVEQAPIDQATFQLAIRIALPDLKGNDLDEIRTNARKLAETEPRLRDASLKMIRSIRVAEIDEKKARAKMSNARGTEYSEPSEQWISALSDLLHLVHQIEILEPP